MRHAFAIPALTLAVACAPKPADSTGSETTASAAADSQGTWKLTQGEKDSTRRVGQRVDRIVVRRDRFELRVGDAFPRFDDIRGLDSSGREVEGWSPMFDYDEPDLFRVAADSQLRAIRPGTQTLYVQRYWGERKEPDRTGKVPTIALVVRP
jgi:hypothetical protein